MSEENKYSKDSIQPIVNPIEHVRKRPGMYIGRVDEIGNLRIISFLFEYLVSHSKWSKTNFVYLQNDTFQIALDSVLNFELTPENINSSGYEMYTLPALSETCMIQSNGKELMYEKGELISEKEVTKANELRITFKFDTAILRSKKLPEYLLLNFFKRYTFLYPEKQIHVFENEQIITSLLSNGLLDWFAVKSFESELLMKPFQFFIEGETIDLKAEIVFSVHNGKETFSTITLPRADVIIDNGTHTKGFLNGFYKAIKEIRGEAPCEIEFTEYRNLIGVFKLSYPNIRFYGPTRNEVGSEELVEVFENATYEKLIANSSFRKTILDLFGS
ncbi:hypothetical protein H2O64_05755 [Kordia sp. YSTF-M3]|uniref:DNA topoisomerase (ATP-hydrolyzing) n=1 Tax=Kordia aestuariivivens TaxID=2759037 RepID=A0ABR7Q6H2_9FLAO|nr:hypothetical protein [Kordia aestuariivivens]MBC8754167.1 hypothetical protein [Kordia aestuariivivens]